MVTRGANSGTPEMAPPASWHHATVTSARRETPDTRTLELLVDDWHGHLAGQHIDVKLTAPDGYTASRSYSIASSAARNVSDPIEITVDRLVDGEVSPYLVEEIAVGEQLEVRGPAGRYFTWDGSDTPVQLIGGGSGIVPLMAMIRTHRDLSSSAPFRLLYSIRSPGHAIYGSEIEAYTNVDATWVFTREAPHGLRAQRMTAATLHSAVWAQGDGASTYICGSTRFVETVANWMVDSGHDPARIRTERFGG